MNSLPKLNIEGLSHPEAENSLVSPVTPATAEDETSVRGHDFGNNRRRIGGLPISALVNEKDDDTPVSYPLGYQAPATTEPVTPARPKFPSILYQMSEFVTQLEERAVKGALPSLKSLGLPSTEQMAARDVQQKSSDGSHSPSRPLTAKLNEAEMPRKSSDGSHSPSKSPTAKGDEVEAPEENEIVASDKGNETTGTEPEKEPKAPPRKRTRAERDMPITTKPEIETLINTLREKEQSRAEELNKRGALESSEAEPQAERKAQTETAKTPTATNLSLGVSRSAKVTKPKKQRRGRPNGDNRPRPHACPTCQRRFHQQSGVVNHYRVVHLKEKRFECPHKCGLRFGARGDVTRHVDAVHNKLRNFECQVCGDAFARKSILTRHCKNMHNDVFGVGEAHDCVHGCVYKPKNNQNEE